MRHIYYNKYIMNLKKFILTILFVFAPATAYADAEIHEPFYAPDAGNTLVTTYFDYSKTKTAGVTEKTLNLAEEISYSIDGYWYAIAGFSNAWNRPEGFPDYQSRYWYAGLSRFIATSENSDILLNLYYTEFRPEGMDRYNTLQFQFCLDLLLDKTIKPYMSVFYDRGIKQIRKSNDYFYFYAGAWTKPGRIMLKAEAETDYMPDSPEMTDVFLNLDAHYKITDNFSAGIYGKTLLYSHYDGTDSMSSRLTGGIAVKYLFR